MAAARKHLGGTLDPAIRVMQRRLLREPHPIRILKETAASERVQRILSEVRELTDEEKAQLETELLADDAVAGRSWGEEVDRRAKRGLATREPGLQALTYRTEDRGR